MTFSAAEKCFGITVLSESIGVARLEDEWESRRTVSVVPSGAQRHGCSYALKLLAKLELQQNDEAVIALVWTRSAHSLSPRKRTGDEA